jgi:DNA-binding MarR family transcriptional regulator
MPKHSDESDVVDVFLEQWAREAPDLDTAPIRVTARVSRVAQLLERHTTAALAPFDLAPSDYNILAALRRSAPPHRLNAGRLTATVLSISGTMTRRVDRLASRGLVTTDVDPADRRSTVVTLTATGRQLVERAAEALVESEARLLEGLPGESRDQLADLLRALLLSLGDRS